MLLLIIKQGYWRRMQTEEFSRTMLKKIDPSLAARFHCAFEIHPEIKKVFPSMSEGVKTIIKKPVTISRRVNRITPFFENVCLSWSTSRLTYARRL